MATSLPRLPPSQPSLSSKQPSQSLAKRLLFHSLPSPPLPPLLASSLAPDLDPELYDFIALALRAYVNPWWTKITRYDKDFLPHITRVLAIVIRTLESRLSAVDLSPLVFHYIPLILSQHYADYRSAQSKLSTSYAVGGSASLPALFHGLQPHIALSSDGTIDPEYYRQILDHILQVCLPPEDYESDAEHFIIREVLLKVLLNDVVPKITQPWFIHKTILILLGEPSDPHIYAPTPTPPPPSSSPHPTFSLHNFIVIILSALQSFSSICLALIHTYKQAISTIKLVNQAPSRSSSLSPWVAPATPRDPFLGPSPHLHSVATPSISESSTISSDPSQLPPSPVSADVTSSYSHHNLHYAYYPLLLFCRAFSTADRFASKTLMGALFMLSSFMIPFLDKLLPHLLFTALSPAFILNLVRLSKRTLFPNGYPGPPPPDPTLEEQAEIRARLAGLRPKGGAAYLLPILLGSNPSETLDAALEPLSSAACNSHTFVVVLDCILLSLFPGLAANSGIQETLK
ncbi:PXA domain-containing protein [Cyathus striatus]|nr:PXA domain-containing protein [Cyathus striatus]